MQVVERLYGMLEIHHDEQAEVRRAGEAILAEIGKTEHDRIKPEILSSQVIRGLDDRQTQLINRTRHGHMIVAGESLYTLEVAPAANAAIAANEAEKAAHIKVIEIVTFGSVGRVYLAGKDRDIDVAWPAAENALRSMTGRSNQK
jgi:D-tyrosyl-tRNA(Tyr) deacylase